MTVLLWLFAVLAIALAIIRKARERETKKAILALYTTHCPDFPRTEEDIRQELIWGSCGTRIVSRSGAQMAVKALVKDGELVSMGKNDHGEDRYRPAVWVAPKRWRWLR